MRMKQHIQAVALLQIGLGILGVLATAIVLAAMLLPAFIVLSEEGGGIAFSVLSIAACGIGSLLIILSVPGIVGGWGLLKYKSWARYLVMVLAVLELFNIPIGTAIGVYSLWALMQEETEKLLSQPCCQ
jgi:hypothetical protein